MKKGKQNNSLPSIVELEEMCKHISEQEKKAQQAERDSIKYMQCVYLSEHIGSMYRGIVTSVMDAGLFVEIEENGCNGFVRPSLMEGDTFVIDTNNYCAKGNITGRIIRLGDEVMVKVMSVDMVKKQIDLKII